MTEQKHSHHFSELQEEELKILCFMAFHGEDSRISAGTEYRKHIKISKTAYDQAIDRLNKDGYMMGRTFVLRNWHIRVLKELYMNHPEWVEKFKYIAMTSRTEIADYLCNLVKCAIAGDFIKASELKRPYIGIGFKQFNLLNYLEAAADEDLRFIKVLNGFEMKEMIEEILETKFAKDELDLETLETLRKLIPEDSHYRYDLLGEIEAYEYFITGKAPADPVAISMWSEGIRAMQLFYQDQLEESVEVFREALNFYTNTNTAFPNLIFNYVYGIALYKLTKTGKHPSAKRKLEMFCADGKIRYSDPNFCIRLLLESIDGTHDETGRAEYIRDRHKEKMYQTFVYLLYSLFEKSTEEIQMEDMHSAAFFQHELSTYLPIGPEAKKRYHQLMGGTPCISKLMKRPKWETTFQEIRESMAKIQDGERRIAYYVDGNHLAALVEQTLEEDGWKDRKVLSLSEMRNKGYDIMDEKDTLIARSLPEGAPYENAAKTIIPILADTDRLYYGYATYHQIKVTVIKDSPYLTFKGKESFIEIGSNTATDSNGNVQKQTLTCTGKGEYHLVTTNAFQRDVMKKFLSLGKVPTSAAISLKKAVDSLNGIVEVRDSNLDSLMKPSVISKGLLSVRIQPEKNIYKATIMATAMENGTGRFTPAEGEQTVYDEVDFLTYCINRNLSAESTNYAILKDYLEQGLGCRFENYTQVTLYGTDILLNLIVFIHDNQDKFFMEWPEGKPLRFKGEIKASDIELTVVSNQDWFTIEGEINTPNIRISLEDLVKSCSSDEIPGFVKIGEDEYIRMSNELRKRIAALEAIPTSRKGVKTIPKYQVGALAEMIQEVRAHTDNGYEEFMKHTQEAYSLDPSIPEGLNATLRDYQIEGFKWMCRLSAWGAGACLADDMGLGKTLQAITFLLYKAQEGPSLVVAPKSILPNWEKELAKFAPSLNYINLNTENNRPKVIKKAGAGDIVLCTYGVLGTQSRLLQTREWNTICLDEAHQIKNRNTLTSHAVMDLKGQNRIILTGTPLQNNLGELWNLFQFINPGILGTWPVFRDTYILGGQDNNHKYLLKDMTTPFILRRTKQEVLSELPGKEMTDILVGMTENEEKVYEEMRKRAETKFKRNKNKAERAEARELDMNFFTELMHLRQAACSMKLVYDKWAEPSSKITTLIETLDELMANPENNVIVFSQFTSFLELIKPELKHRSTPYLYMDGQTPLEKRQQYVDDFQEGRCRLFLSSLKAGGLGLNLTRANYVIILDPWWNPAIENQAMDRAHRLGQQRIVTVIRLISAHTIEEKILRMHQDKQALCDEMLQGTGTSSKLTYEDIMDMVSPF